MLFRCAPRAPASEQGGAIVRRGAKRMVVDIHCHRQSARADELMKLPAFPVGNPLTVEVNRQQLVDIKPQMESIERRLADMDRMGIDMQAVSPAPSQYYYAAEPDQGRAA
jgi:aminocarboxymuconate-semialdehyde decarboxylase